MKISIISQNSDVSGLYRAMTTLIAKDDEIYWAKCDDELIELFFDKGIHFDRIFIHFTPKGDSWESSAKVVSIIDALESIREDFPGVKIIIFSHVTKETVKRVFDSLQPFDFVSLHEISHTSHQHI